MGKYTSISDLRVSIDVHAVHRFRESLFYRQNTKWKKTPWILRNALPSFVGRDGKRCIVLYAMLAIIGTEE